MKLLIGIATYKRTEKLKRCIESILKSTYQDFEIMVVCDNMDLDTAEEIKALYPNIMLDVQPAHKFVIGAWNLCIQTNIEDKWDGFIGLCDDVVLDSRALEFVVKFHQDHYIDGDGVIGFNQACPGHPEYIFKWFGQTLMGRKFVERYKEADYQICCPDYKHFYQDEEMFQYASSMGKFYPCKQALLYHYHPGFVKEEHDETHDVIRKGKYSPREYDTKKWLERQSKNYLWGRDFNLIGA